jgi:outer membrane protein
MWTPRFFRAPVVCGLLAVASPSFALAQQVELVDAVREALASNLDLAARERALAADGEAVELARSRLLPQMAVAARVQRLDDDRSDSERGDSTQDSLTLAGKLTQTIYDETDRAGVTIERHRFAGQALQLESFRLGLIRDVASAFLELDRAGATLGIQQQNRGLTVRNLETSRSRIAAGWSSDREVLRWQSQLASNDTAVVEARTQMLLSRFELNRVRNRSAEASIDPTPVTIDSYGFVYARKGIVDAIATPQGDRRLRDLLVSRGIGRSPDLATIDEAIAAAERELLADRRQLWLPSLGVDASLNHVANDGSGSDDADFEDTEWVLGATLAFPLYQGGGKFASLRQTRQTLSGLRIERRAATQSLDQAIRAAFAQASGSYASLQFAKDQEAAAARNYELVNDSYVLGVASILGLLDAQSQRLIARSSRVGAFYDFFEDLVAAEQQISLYPFLESEADMRALQDRIEQALAP